MHRATKNDYILGRARVLKTVERPQKLTKINKLNILYMQEYRSGHNEAVLKTVRPKATGVRIPLPAPKET